jgi:S1-C subfamily serine protease
MSHPADGRQDPESLWANAFGSDEQQAQAQHSQMRPVAPLSPQSSKTAPPRFHSSDRPRSFRLDRRRRDRRPLSPVALAAAFVTGVAVTVAAVVGFVPEREVRTVIRETPLASRSRDGHLSPQAVYRRDAPGVVFITASTVSSAAQDSGVATGTGFVISDDGQILTNAHVVAGAAEVSVQFDDDDLRTARVLGVDESTDLALLKIDADGRKLHPLTLGDSDDVAVGDPVLALGNPFGLEQTLTEGIVSAVRRSIPSLNQFQISDVIQTDAAINPGNSGGPLLDSRGRVVGINSQIHTADRGGGNVGIAFAVPINTAKRILPQLAEHGEVRRAYLGTTTASVTAALRSFDLGADRGALVQDVAADSPAAEAGLRAGSTRVQLGPDTVAVGGDVIVAIDGRAVADSESVSRTIERLRPGRQITLTVIRDGRRISVPVTLRQRND